jgi:hypothetical protein
MSIPNVCPDPSEPLDVATHRFSGYPRTTVLCAVMLCTYLVSIRSVSRKGECKSSWVFLLVTPMLEAAGTSETSAYNYQTKSWNISEDSHVCCGRRENLAFYLLFLQLR